MIKNKNQITIQKVLKEYFKLHWSKPEEIFEEFLVHYPDVKDVLCEDWRVYPKKQEIAISLREFEIFKGDGLSDEELSEYYPEEMKEAESFKKYNPMIYIEKKLDVYTKLILNELDYVFKSL